MVNVVGAEKYESLVQLAPIHSPGVRCVPEKLVNVSRFAVVALVGLSCCHNEYSIFPF